jgi:flagellar basal-body rod protein FlgG
MDRGLYIAAGGMLAEQRRQEAIANDLANAATPGYKSDRVAQQSFDDLLLARDLDGQSVGRQSLRVGVAEVRTDWTPQASRETGEPLDFTIDGAGFFAVQTDAGVRYTRNGQFSADADGRLVTATGDRVLGTNGGPVPIGADGRVDPRALRVVTLTGAAKEGDNHVTGTPGGGPAGRARAGALEASGADATRSMIDMIASMRAFEAGQKVIQTIDATLDKAANRVGTVNG